MNTLYAQMDDETLESAREMAQDLLDAFNADTQERSWRRLWRKNTSSADGLIRAKLLTEIHQISLIQRTRGLLDDERRTLLYCEL